MNKEQINTLATIATRYAELNSASKQAKQAITEARFKAFNSMLSDEDKQTLYAAEDILSKIAGKTNVRDAVNYFESLNN